MKTELLHQLSFTITCTVNKSTPVTFPTATEKRQSQAQGTRCWRLPSVTNVITRREGNRTFVPVSIDDAQNHSERHRMDENRTELLLLARSQGVTSQNTEIFSKPTSSQPDAVSLDLDQQHELLVQLEGAGPPRLTREGSRGCDQTQDPPES